MKERAEGISWFIDSILHAFTIVKVLMYRIMLALPNDQVHRLDIILLIIVVVQPLSCV